MHGRIARVDGQGSLNVLFKFHSVLNFFFSTAKLSTSAHANGVPFVSVSIIIVRF